MATRKLIWPTSGDKRYVRRKGLPMMARAIGAGLLMPTLLGCAAQPSPTAVIAATPTEAPTASAGLARPPSLNAEEVAAEVALHLQSMCERPADELPCSVVQFEWITFDNGILSVPTVLDADAVDDAGRVCSLFDTPNMNQAGAIVSVEIVDILSTTGAFIASCEPEV
jgi:hypothetical protein